LDVLTKKDSYQEVFLFDEFCAFAPLRENSGSQRRRDAKYKI